MHVSIVNNPLLESDKVFIASLSLENQTDLGRVQLNNPAAASIRLSLTMTVVNMQSLKINILCYLFYDNIPSDVVIGFVPPTYTVVEGVDQFASLTVQLISGQLGYEVIVNLTTQSESAIGIILPK